jgi:hypothetical protein
LIFIELASDLKSMRVIKQAEFSGVPVSSEGSIYPVEDGTWQNENSYLVTLDGTCNADKSQLGPYLFDLSTRSASKTSSGTPVAGDLGWGTIHGSVTDAVTGAAIAGATVSCEHFSYTSPSTCAGTTTTSEDGSYLFENIFFHDTDRITITAQASGYQSQEITSTAFTAADLQADLSLSPSQ